MVIQHYSKNDLEMNFEQYVTFAKQDITDRYAAKITEQSVKAGKINAKQLTYSLIINNNPLDYRMLLFEQNDDIYTLMLASPSKVSKQANAEFNEIIESIKLN